MHSVVPISARERTRELDPGLPQPASDLRPALARVLAYPLQIERGDSARERRPAHIETRELIARFAFLGHVHVAVVAADEKIAERLGVARTTVAAPLRGTRQADLESRHGIEREARAEQQRVVDVATVVEPAEERRQRPCTDPAQPARPERSP